MESTEMVSGEQEESAGLQQLLEGMTPGETSALNTLMNGGTMSAAAKAAEVSRSTIYLWLAPGKPVYEALLLWKKDFSETARTRLLMLTQQATANVARSLRDGDVKVSVILLQRLGLMGPPPVGPPQAEAVAEVARNKAASSTRREVTEVRAVSFTESWSGMGGLDEEVGRGADEG